MNDKNLGCYQVYIYLLLDTADEATVLTVQEARQIAVMVNIPFVVPFDDRVAIFMVSLVSHLARLVQTATARCE